jgi:hypothetical protein
MQFSYESSSSHASASAMSPPRTDRVGHPDRIAHTPISGHARALARDSLQRKRTCEVSAITARNDGPRACGWANSPHRCAHRLRGRGLPPFGTPLALLAKTMRARDSSWPRAHRFSKQRGSGSKGAGPVRLATSPPRRCREARPATSRSCHGNRRPEWRSRTSLRTRHNVRTEHPSPGADEERRTARTRSRRSRAGDAGSLIQATISWVVRSCLVDSLHGDTTWVVRESPQRLFRRRRRARTAARSRSCPPTTTRNTSIAGCQLTSPSLTT